MVQLVACMLSKPDMAGSNRLDLSGWFVHIVPPS